MVVSGVSVLPTYDVLDDALLDMKIQEEEWYEATTRPEASYADRQGRIWLHGLGELMTCVSCGRVERLHRACHADGGL